MKNRPFHQRLGYAIAGLRAGFANERSFRTHCLFALLALIALCVLKPAPLWWAIVALAVAAVMALELVNAALETLLDHLHPDLHPQIRIVKDMAAGSVLLASLASLVVAGALVTESLSR